MLDPGIPCGMRVAAVQTTAGPDRDENLEAAARLVESAADAGAELVVLPELFSVAGSPDYLRGHAEEGRGPTATWAADLAARRRIHLLAGSYPEQAEGGRVFNTSCLLDPSGSVVAAYRKVHLFDVQLAETEIRESATFVAGDELCVAPLAGPNGAPAAVLGLSICYDLRFPELYRALTLPRRHRRGRALRVHRGYRPGSLGAAPAGTGDGEPDLCDRCRTGRTPPVGHARLSRALDDRRPVGSGDGVSDRAQSGRDRGRPRRRASSAHQGRAAGVGAPTT